MIIPRVLMKLLNDKWEKEDNLTVYMMKIKQGYRETCELYDIEEIPHMSLNTMIAKRITGNMTETGRWTYYDRLERCPEKIIEEMEEDFRYDKEFKDSLFKHKDIAKDNSEYVSPMIAKERKVNCYGTGMLRRCWNYGKGFCKFGGFCWYKHE